MRTLHLSSPFSKEYNQHATLIDSTCDGKRALIPMSHHTQKNKLQTDYRSKYERQKNCDDLEVGNNFLSKSQK